jgi:hypothetical protein
MFVLEKAKELQRDQMLGFDVDDEVDNQRASVIF